MLEPNRSISSGGVDLFCADKERIIHQGAKLGIHSWAGIGISADESPKNHPAHQSLSLNKVALMFYLVKL